MKKAIIFDLDGTLWDSSASVCESWNIVFSRYPEITRRLTPADVQGFMGKTLDQIFPIALPDTPDELRRKALNECVHYELEYIAEHGGRLRKYYRITEAGLKRIEEFKAEWEEILSIYRFVTKEDDGNE